MCNYRKDNTSIFAEGECLPVNVDWFGFDFYHEDSSSWNAVREAYESYIFPRMSRPDQRVVPVSLGYNQANLSAAEASRLDDFCADNARQFLRYGLEEKRVVGTFPFYWHGAGTREPDGSIINGTAIDLLPNCRATYKAIGDLIKAAGPAGTSLDPTHNPPKGSTFPEPSCRGPFPPPPPTWSWCDRSNRTRTRAQLISRLTALEP